MRLIFIGYILGIIFGILIYNIILSFYNKHKIIGTIFVSPISDKKGKCLIKIIVNEDTVLKDFKDRKTVKFKVKYDINLLDGGNYE